MNYDRLITISAAGNRKSLSWPPQQLMWSELITRISAPVRSTEPFITYLRMKKAQQDDLKDVGGFVAGELDGGRRKGSAVKGRDIVTLDMDALPAGGADDVLRMATSLGCAWAIYSTRKHEPAKPRLRVLLPLSRTVTADEYEPIARKLAELLRIDWCDPTTFQAVRMMYWPSVCADGQYIFQYEDKPFADADGILGLYADWRNVMSWPQVAGQPKAQQPSGPSQADPTSKDGIVGAFCRSYSITQALDTFIPGVYEPVDGAPDRFTFSGGSTTGGAIVYDDKFLYSHHATDPAGGRLVNAFDLVRLHLYSSMDDEAKEGTPTASLPSYVRMKQFAVADAPVSKLINQERYDQVTADFGKPPETEEAAAGTGDWMGKLKINANNAKPDKTAANVLLMLEHDPRLTGRFKLDTFASRIWAEAPLPWGKRENVQGPFSWEDADEAGLRVYVERILGFRSKDIVEDAFKDHLARHSYNPVQDYLHALNWDSTPRLDTLFIDYLGAEDSEYTRTVTRKAFTAGIARAMTPGVKYDTMTILSGATGIGKSTLLRKMAHDRWFNDSIRSFEGKDASELLQGVWVVEISELEAFAKSDVSRIKQFLSQTNDIYRAAYGRSVEWHERRCVFFGTSNPGEYLRDPNGNRRFWPIDVGLVKAQKSVFTQLDDEVDQIWAEAYVRWQTGESLYLTGAVADTAISVQESHRERSSREGIILKYLEDPVPETWQEMDLQQRLVWLGGGYKEYAGRLQHKEKICAAEIWAECFRGDLKYIKYPDTMEINNVIRSAAGWKSSKNGIRCGYSGLQRGFYWDGNALVNP